jgi:hypothetical protein
MSSGSGAGTMTSASLTSTAATIATAGGSTTSSAAPATTSKSGAASLGHASVKGGMVFGVIFVIFLPLVVLL